MPVPLDEKEESRRMILSPLSWPLLFLPLKRRRESGFPDCAVLMTGTSDPNAKLVVRENATVYGPIGDVITREYEGVDALLADGWVVD